MRYEILLDFTYYFWYILSFWQFGYHEVWALQMRNNKYSYPALLCSTAIGCENKHNTCTLTYSPCFHVTSEIRYYIAKVVRDSLSLSMSWVIRDVKSHHITAVNYVTDKLYCHIMICVNFSPFIHAQWQVHFLSLVDQPPNVLHLPPKLPQQSHQVLVLQ